MHFHTYLDNSPSTLRSQVRHGLAERLRPADDSLRVAFHEVVDQTSCEGFWGCEAVPLECDLTLSMRVGDLRADDRGEGQRVGCAEVDLRAG